MAHFITFVSAKGGTGKTTCITNLAVALADKGQPTLLIDLDPQGSIGLAFNKSDTEWTGLAEYMMNRATVGEIILETKLAGFHIVPRGRLNPLDVCEFETALFNGEYLNKLLRWVDGRYAFVLIDTPAGLGMITRSALRESRFAIAPLQAETLALRSFSQTLHLISALREQENPHLELLGILPTMVSLSQDQSLSVMNTLWSGFGGVFDTFIPRADVFHRASAVGLPVAFLAGRLPPEARRFEILATEIITTVTERDKTAGETDEREQRELF